MDVKLTHITFILYLASKIDGCVWFETFDLVAEYVTEHAQNGDLVITLGCGDVNKVADLIVKKLKKLSNKNDNIKSSDSITAF